MDQNAPPSRIFRLLYASRMTPAVEANLDAELRSILAASVRNNRAHQITGLLIGHRGWFVQALEGPERPVEQRFDIIRHDRRHGEFTVISWGHVSHRAFPRWSMCAHGLTATDAAILDTLSYKDEFDPSKWNEATVMRLFGAVSKIHSRALADRYARAKADADRINAAA